MSIALGIQTIVSIAGPSTPITAEACTQEGATETYRIANAAHRILNPAVAIVVKDDGAAVADANIKELRPLFGEVEFIAGYTPAGAITIDGAFLTLCQVPGAFDASLSVENDEADATEYAQGDAQKRRVATTQQATIQLKGHGTGSEDYDTATGGDQTIAGLVAAGTPTLIQYDPGSGGTDVFRGWFFPKGRAVGTPLNDLVNYTTNWSSTGRGPNAKTRAGFDWGTT